MPPPSQGQQMSPKNYQPGAPAGMGAPPQGQGFPPPQQRMPMPARPGTTFPNPANVDNLSGQMTGMNLNGPAPPNQQMNVNGPQKMGQPSVPPMVGGGRYPAPLNGGPTPQMNGIPDPNAPRPMQQRYPQENTQNFQGGYPPMSSPPGGYPPQPGYMPQQAPFPAAQPSYPSGQQPQRRLDPDLMPSPIDVVMEDQRSRSGIFYTNQKGMPPPLVSTDFIAVDQGNSSPRFMRSTMYNVPVNADMMKQAATPFALVISPMAELLEEEQPPPLVDFGEMGPVRCIRCKAYMCPNMQFFDGGRRFLCLLCKATTEVPAEYFQHLDQTGLRVDRYERAELMLGTYDIVATKEYCRDSIPPKPPALIFLIDVSYNNVKSGLVSLLCAQMKSFLYNLPKERGQEKSSLKVGFITYNSSVHFYNMNPNLGQPQMLVVGDVHEMFMPLLDGFLVDVEQSEGLIDMLMQQIPTMFADTKETETILAPAIQAGLEALKAAGCAGKLLVFHSSLPTFEAPGKLKNRDDRKLLGTEKEKTVLTPQNKVYNELGQECVQSGCSVDLFIFNNSYIDLATIGQVARLTGGDVYKYTYFQADLDGDRVVADVRANVRRLCAFDAIMRVRTSAGVRPTDFYGHFFMSNTTDIELAAIDPDKAVAVEIKHDDKLSEEDGVYIQTALLYTSLCGQRRIRILNLALKACSQMSELYRTCELDTLMNFFAKQAVFKLLDATPKGLKDNYITRSAQILACYRKNCASPTSAGQLILPECMKLLPLYMNCMLKCDAVSGGSDMTVDDRWFTMAAVSTMDVPSSAVYLYPRLVPIEDIGDDMPSPIRCSADKMADDGVYLLDNGIYLFLWLGLAVPSDWVSAVFGVPSTSQVDTDKNRLPVLDNQLSEKIREYIGLVGSSRHRSMRLTVVRQRDKMELVMKHFLVEDKGLDGSASYVDFLCHLHKEIRNIVS
uniref:Protein transport protein Sec24C n=1 Tax=Lygus hesperus TaxID=30085 RepID=A0A0A9W2S1_LYGHE